MQSYKQKFVKNHLLFLKKKAKNCYTNNYGKFGLKALSSGYITVSQIETVKKLCLKFVKYHNTTFNTVNQYTTIWSRENPSIFTTSKGSETRIGGGKGSLKTKIIRVSSGQILLEFNLDSIITAKKLVNLISVRLPIKVCLAYNFNF
uniref:50S ribosomal protein L16 n=1 Tax=Cyanidiococcus yangmingshanensis TaxID=2690220 RepID=A0A7H0WBF4_9RHOD|nr:50S ribosomal protein L16 [Cyanidiococcus yangmingshanensis]UNJ18935.1 ribosomal protein L16 [Cyanidioschyzonaceae sp. 2 FvB-2021]